MPSFARLYVHIVWTTFERAQRLPPERDDWLRECLLSIGRRQHFAIGRVGIASDHIHTIVRLPRDRPVADVVQYLKGVSAHDWNVRFGEPRLRWQAHYWAESISPRDVPALLDFVDNQRTHHASPVTETWEAFDEREGFDLLDPPFPVAPACGRSPHRPMSDFDTQS